MILFGSNEAFSSCSVFSMLKSLKRLVCHKKEFPFYKNRFFKGKIRNTFIGHILTLSEKNEL